MYFFQLALDLFADDADCSDDKEGSDTFEGVLVSLLLLFQVMTCYDDKEGGGVSECRSVFLLSK